jgi:hypothetical protein
VSWLKAFVITVALVCAAVFAIVLVFLLVAFIIESTLFVEQHVSGLVAIAYLLGWCLVPLTVIVKKTAL